jgi:hypothetical protein
VLHIEIAPTRVVRVVVDAQHAVERTVDSATLLLLAPFLQTIDRELKAAMQSFLDRHPPTNANGGPPCRS